MQDPNEYIGGELIPRPIKNKSPQENLIDLNTIKAVAITNYLNNNFVNPHSDGGDYNKHLEVVCNMMGIYFYGEENGWYYDDMKTNNKL